MTTALPLVDAALRGALLATLLLLGTALARVRATHAAPRVGLALTIGLALQVAASLPAIERGWPIAWQAPLVGVSVGNSVLFWLFAQALFDDAFVWRRGQAVVWATVAAIGAAFCLSLGQFGPLALSTTVLRLLLRGVPAVFAVLVVAAAASQWRADLVEPRRRLRAFVVVAGATYAVGMVVVRLNAAHGVPSPAAAVLDTAALLAITLAAALATLRSREDGGLLAATAAASPVGVPSPRTPGAPESVTRSASTSPPPMETTTADVEQVASAPDALEMRLAADLDRMMTVDRAYRIDDLTLGLLALKLGVPEYRLRRHIHDRLGQRNFNAWLNGLRLAEVRAALADPARASAGVLALALEAGFASAGPFNRAFKADTGMTPTEFRRQALAYS